MYWNNNGEKGIHFLRPIKVIMASIVQSYQKVFCEKLRSPCKYCIAQGEKVLLGAIRLYAKCTPVNNLNQEEPRRRRIKDGEMNQKTSRYPLRRYRALNARSRCCYNGRLFRELTMGT